MNLAGTPRTDVIDEGEEEDYEDDDDEDEEEEEEEKTGDNGVDLLDMGGMGLGESTKTPSTGVQRDLFGASPQVRFLCIWSDSVLLSMFCIIHSLF